MEGHKKNCWWCKDKANSREHIFKKSDLKRVFGSTLNPPTSSQIIEDGIRQRRVQGPDSRFVKWEANLCSKCNNSKSSPFDRAYDEFVKNMQPLFTQTMRDKSIDLRLIFGEDWKYRFNELLKYYVKHIACRLSHHLLEVPQNIIDFLNDFDRLRDIIFQFEVRPMNKIVAETSNSMFNNQFEVLRVGLLSGVENNINGNKSTTSYFSWLTTGWISVGYVIQDNIYPDGFNSLENSIIPLEIGPIVSSVKYKHLPNIAEKTSFLDDFGRTGNSLSLQKYYCKLLGNKAL